MKGTSSRQISRSRLPGRAKPKACVAGSPSGESSALIEDAHAVFPKRHPGDSLKHQSSSGSLVKKSSAFHRVSAANKAHAILEYTHGEEIANSFSHGAGVVLALCALLVLVVQALHAGQGQYLFAVMLYSLSMLLEYSMSTLYHALTAKRAKRVFKVLDHSCIYLFIAGSYTPFYLISLANSGGLWLCVFVWAVALAGVACEAFWVFRPRWISAVLYLLLGWSVIGYLPALIAALPPAGFWLLISGGICYSLGCIFYVLKKIPFMHSIFHLWVLAGSVLQFLSITWYVM